MKKHLPIIAAWLISGFPCSVSSQHVLEGELNMYRPYDIIVKQQVSYKDPGRTGPNVLWDFSALSVENDAYELSYTTDNDTIITGTEHLTRYHYTLQNDSLLLWGFDSPTTQVKNIQPELLLKFPVNYGETSQSCYYTHGKYGNRLEVDLMGTIETTADAFGMMILPDKDTLRNVLRTRTLKYIAEETVPISKRYYDKTETPLQIHPDSIAKRLNTDSLLFITETFRWYEKGYRYPIFETIRSWEQHNESEAYHFLNTAFFYPPQEHYYLDEDEANRELLENREQEAGGSDGSNTPSDPWTELSYNIYPNPVTAILAIEIYLPQTAHIHIQLRNTMGLILLEEEKGSHPVGTCDFQSDLSAIPVGNYVLDIWLNEHLVSEIIMKR
jgi:hypothetical protein